MTIRPPSEQPTEDRIEAERIRCLGEVLKAAFAAAEDRYSLLVAETVFARNTSRD
jgi:hypothetical protein